MRTILFTVVTWVSICLFVLVSLFLITAQAEEFNDQVMDIPTKCEYHRSKIREIQTQFAQRIFVLWLHEGSKIDPRKLYDQADYTAWWILRDTNIICRHYK